MRRTAFTAVLNRSLALLLSRSSSSFCLLYAWVMTTLTRVSSTTAVMAPSAARPRRDTARSGLANPRVTTSRTGTMTKVASARSQRSNRAAP